MIPELRMIARLIRDIPSLIQRNSWRTFFKSCTISQLAFAYPLVKQNGRLLLLLSSWLQNYLSIHHQAKPGKSTKTTRLKVEQATIFKVFWCFRTEQSNKTWLRSLFVGFFQRFFCYTIYKKFKKRRFMV